MMAVFLVSGVAVLGAGLGYLQNDEEAQAYTVSINDMEAIRVSLIEHYDGAPIRQTTMTSVPATMSYGDPVTIHVDAWPISGGYDELDGCSSGWCEIGGIETAPLVLSTADGDIYLTSAALIISSGDGGQLLRTRSPWNLGQEYTQIPLIETQYGAGPRAVSLDGTTGVGQLYVVTQRDISPDATTSVTWDPRSDGGDTGELQVRYVVENTSHADAWRAYFQRPDNGFTYDADASDLAEGMVVAMFETEKLTVKRTTINVRFDA